MFRRRIPQQAPDGGAKTSSPKTTEAGHSAACLSDTGRHRDHNEDSFGEDTSLGLWIVADGLGGHDAGEVASELAVSHIARLVAEGRPLADAVSKAHDLIRHAPSEGIGTAGMGATVVAAQLTDCRYRVCWVGDSRAYIHGADGLKRVTVDHTYVQRLVDSGAITADEAEVHPERSVVTQCLGADELPVVEVGESVGELYDGDVLLLCTDGLTGEVEDVDIDAVLRRKLPMAEKAQRLVDEANAKGGSDNITVALIAAPAEAQNKPAQERTREIPTYRNGKVRTGRKSRTVVWWTSLATAVVAISVMAWIWRERVVEMAPVILRYVQESISAPSSDPVAPIGSSSVEAALPETGNQTTGADQAEDAATSGIPFDQELEVAAEESPEPAPSLRIGEELAVSPQKPLEREDAPMASEDPKDLEAPTPQQRD